MFADAKHPYLYFTLNCFDTWIDPVTNNECKLPVAIPGDKLLLRFNHAFSKETGVKLDSPVVTVKRPVLAKADPLGLGGSINVGEEVVFGVATLTPINEEVERLE